MTLGIFALGIILGAALIAAYFHFLVMPAWKDDQSRIFAHLEHDRDQARHEAKVFRRLILPNFDKAESLISGAAAPALSPLSDLPARAPEGGAAARSLTPSSAAPQAFQGRMPFRLRWKRAAAEMNSKQQKTNAMATMIQAQLDAAKAAKKTENPSHGISS